ncbi:FAD-dependent oxidoreductase [Rhodopirellula sp. MGV]|uniref:FAD-dependent oxidoreductase n=1 Tax=Rhodopirellula sp. MGV TaxID=2023130 RepID=UPI001E2F3464|nr:FAD-dependent oxidoreductase [Rhodopirellula sp. MGV]
MKQVVLLGIGHTNAHILHQWIDAPIPDCELVCVTQFPQSTYSGMMPGTLGEQFERNETRIDLPRLAEAAGARLIVDETTGLDLDSRRLQFANHGAQKFDALSIGVGSVPLGYEPYREVPHVVPVKPMQTFLERLDQALAVTLARVNANDASNDPPLRVMVVGGGVAGVEISFCLRQRLLREQVRHTIQLVTAGDAIADGMKEKSVRRIERLLLDRGIGVSKSDRVVGIDGQKLRMKSGLELFADVIVWVTGAAPPPVIAALGLQTDDRGFIATAATLQTHSDGAIFAVGDCGTNPDVPCPKAGVYAVRQGPVLWHNLNAVIQGSELQAFRPQQGFLKLINTGDGKALLDYRRWTLHHRWCLKLKNHIDRDFIRRYQK